jgi:hypothetical protein
MGLRFNAFVVFSSQLVGSTVTTGTADVQFRGHDTARRSALGGPAFGVDRLAFGVRRLAFAVLAFGGPAVQRSRISAEAGQSSAGQRTPSSGDI